MDAYFRRVNDNGGIHGRTVKLQVEDDGFWPANTPKLARKLVERDRVFAMVGNLGTATTAAIIDYLNAQGVPLLFVVSGSDAWADYRKYPLTMGLQVSYAAESRLLGHYVAATWPRARVGALYQNDDFGRAFLSYKGALAITNQVTVESPFEPSSRDLSQQIKTLRAAGTEVLMLAAGSEAAGLSLKTAADVGWKPSVLASSAAADPALFGLSGGAAIAEGVISSIWQRPYDEAGIELQPVRELLTSYAPQVPYTQLAVTGYAIAELTADALERAGENPTRASLMAAAESFHNFKMQPLINGSLVSTSKTDHAPVKSIQLTRATGGRFVPFGDVLT
jgi:ABC-type branched-subunit amino acid transport system substrate-binding protein